MFHTPSVLLCPSNPVPYRWPFLAPPQLFKEELTQVKEGMKHINDLAHQLAISDVHLSMENARSLEHLNSRWKVLQVEFMGGSGSGSGSQRRQFLRCFVWNIPSIRCERFTRSVDGSRD